MITSADFLAVIEGYLAESEVKPSRFGKDVLGDPRFVFDLRDGRRPSLDVVNKVLDHIKANPAASPATEAAA